MQDLVVGAHRISLDLIERLEGGQKILTTATEVDRTIIVRRVVAIVRNVELSTVHDKLLLICLGFVDEDFKHTDSVRLVSRHRIEDVRLTALLVTYDEELLEEVHAGTVLLLIDLLHVGTAKDGDGVCRLACQNYDAFRHFELIAALARVQIVGHKRW